MKLAILLLLVAGCAAQPIVAENISDGRGYCPLCQEWHDAVQMKWPADYGGKTYAFCDPNCRAAFLRDPEKCLKDPHFKPK